jgi:hypothetical protein
MDYDAAFLMTGPASLLLNLVGFLIFSAVALCAARGPGDGGRRHRIPGGGLAHVAPIYRRSDVSKPIFGGGRA